MGGLWFFNIVNWLTGSKLNNFGIEPRKISGLIGIPLCPILHQNFNHLFFNSIPLFALGLAILADSIPTFIEVTIFVTIVGGFAVWLFARRAIHIGASGLVSGYFGYIVATAYTNPSFTTVLLAAVMLYYFGGIFLGIFPQKAKVSWESHLFGFLSGVFCAFIPPEYWQMLGFPAGNAT